MQMHELDDCVSHNRLEAPTGSVQVLKILESIVNFSLAFAITGKSLEFSKLK